MARVRAVGFVPRDPFRESLDAGSKNVFAGNEYARGKASIVDKTMGNRLGSVVLRGENIRERGYGIERRQEQKRRTKVTDPRWPGRRRVVGRGRLDGPGVYVRIT